MNLAHKIKEIVDAAFLEDHFRAVVTGTSGSLVTIRRTGQSAPDSQSYARLDSYSSPMADDEVIVLRVGRSYIVLGKVTR